MKQPGVLATAVCSAIFTGGLAFVALVLVRLKSKAVGSEYIVLPSTSAERNVTQKRERVLQSV